MEQKVLVKLLCFTYHSWSSKTRWNSCIYRCWTCFRSSLCKALGVDIDELLISQPDYGEQALEIADTLVRSGAIDLIVIDSVAALVPKAEIDGEMSDQQMGLQARLMSKGLRKLTGNL